MARIITSPRSRERNVDSWFQLKQSWRKMEAQNKRWMDGRKWSSGLLGATRQMSCLDDSKRPRIQEMFG